ncbi:helix-turn-helix domain-containing protein [Streptomyces sp. NPDC001165]|uniref:helix-turn-helix domain-containing protein n=1 Tax=Streptomyces sp. NPDC001165 TaxID=3364546 RepID=UPI003686C37B
MLGSCGHIKGPARQKLGAELKKAYSRGASIRTLARGCGRSYGFVHRVLSEAGTVMRTRGGSNARRRTQGAREGERIAGYRGRPSGGSP